MSVGFQKLIILTHIKMATFINVILLQSMIFTLFTTGVYSIQCPGDSNEKHGHWKSDRDRCILKCLEGYEPSGCHVLRKTDKDEWSYKLPNCIAVEAWYIPGRTATKVGAAVVVGAGAVVAAPVVLAAAGFGSAGVVAGPLAAGMQVFIQGRIQDFRHRPQYLAGSVFAALQSAGVLGFAIGTKVTIMGATSGVTYAFMSTQCEIE